MADIALIAFHLGLLRLLNTFSAVCVTLYKAWKVLSVSLMISLFTENLAKEHGKHLTAVLHKVAAGITLNLEKCEFSCKEIRFLGQLVDKQGICADPNKVKAIQQIK